MRRTTPVYAAIRTAFAPSRGRSSAPPATDVTTGLRIHRAALAFVAGFPGVIGGGALLAAVSRAGTVAGAFTRDGAFPLAVSMLLIAGILLLLGARSFLSVGTDTLTVRFFGLRSTTVRFSELVSATFGMAFPSISFAIALTDRNGRKALVHSNWWRGEAAVLALVCRALVEHDVPMDRATARVVSQVLGGRRPRARIVHRGFIRKDRTW